MPAYTSNNGSRNATGSTLGNLSGRTLSLGLVHKPTGAQNPIHALTSPVGSLVELPSVSVPPHSFRQSFALPYPLFREATDEAAAVEVDVQWYERTDVFQWLEDEVPLWTATGRDTKDGIRCFVQERRGCEKSGEKRQRLEKKQSPPVSECDGGEYSVGRWLKEARQE